MSDVYVVGVDMIQFGRFPERSVPEIGAEAVLGALDDCGLRIQDMEALYCGNLYQAAAMVGQRILQQIGQTGIPWSTAPTPARREPPRFGRRG